MKVHVMLVPGKRLKIDLRIEKALGFFQIKNFFNIFQQGCNESFE